MKTKVYAALIACMAIVGLLQASTQAVAEPSCPGSGTTCARSSDNTLYYKGAGNEVESF